MRCPNANRVEIWRSCLVSDDVSSLESGPLAGGLRCGSRLASTASPRGVVPVKYFPLFKTENIPGGVPFAAPLPALVEGPSSLLRVVQ